MKAIRDARSVGDMDGNMERLFRKGFGAKLKEKEGPWYLASCRRHLPSPSIGSFL